MAFDLKRVLKVMLFASNGPLSVKDIQTAITRFHEQVKDMAIRDCWDVKNPSPSQGLKSFKDKFHP